MPPQPEESPNQAAYAGRWIATIGGRIVSQGGTPEQARQAARSARPKEVPDIHYVALNQPLSFSPWIQKIGSILPADVSVYLVGGAVRDGLLQRPTHDLDFVVSANAIQIARRVANALKGAFYLLDEERQTARVILQPSEADRLVFDFALQRGPDLEDDLKGRDFTVNAMAVDIREPDALLDPLNGAADLLAKKLRACSPDAFVNDPVRILRAVRLASEYHLKILSETRKGMRLAVQRLDNVSPERQRDELFRIFGGSQPALVIRALDILGALEVVLPEIVKQKEVTQAPPHREDVFDHTLATLQWLESLLATLAPRFIEETASNLTMGLVAMRLGRYRQQIGERLSLQWNPDRADRSLLFMAALYHDAGKPFTRQVDSQGRIHFLEHEKIGAEIIARRAKVFNLSNPETQFLSTVIRHHLRPLWLARHENPPSARTVYRFFRDTGAAGVDTCLLALADVLSAYGTDLSPGLWERHLDVVRALLEGWWERPQSLISPPRLVNGDDLMAEFNLSPGAQIGKLLEAIREAQVSGEVSTPQEAIELARLILKGEASAK